MDNNIHFLTGQLVRKDENQNSTPICLSWGLVLYLLNFKMIAELYVEIFCLMLTAAHPLSIF